MIARTSNSEYKIYGFNNALNDEMKSINIELNVDLTTVDFKTILKAEENGTEYVVIDYEDGTTEEYNAFNNFVSLEEAEGNIAILIFD